MSTTLLKEPPSPGEKGEYRVSAKLHPHTAERCVAWATLERAAVD